VLHTKYLNITIHSCVYNKTRHFRRVRKLAKSDYLLRHVCPSVRACPWNNLATSEQIFMKFDISGFLKNVLKIFKFH